MTPDIAADEEAVDVAKPPSKPDILKPPFVPINVCTMFNGSVAHGVKSDRPPLGPDVIFAVSNGVLPLETDVDEDAPGFDSWIDGNDGPPTPLLFGVIDPWENPI